MQDEITINGVTYLRKVAEKTNAEKLEQYFMEGFGRPTEFANGRSMICEANIVHVSRTGNRVTVVYDAGE